MDKRSFLFILNVFLVFFNQLFNIFIDHKTVEITMSIFRLMFIITYNQSIHLLFLHFMKLTSNTLIRKQVFSYLLDKSKIGI